MVPIILQIIQKIKDYLIDKKLQKNQVDKGESLEKKLLQFPLFGQLKLLYRNYCEKVIQQMKEENEEKIHSSQLEQE